MNGPLNEDDYPDDHVVSLKPIGQGEERRSFNHIKEEGKDFYRPLNIQKENTNDTAEQ